jgi:hypothetical protein
MPQLPSVHRIRFGVLTRNSRTLPRIRSALYPRSAATATLCCRGGRLRVAAKPRRADILGMCIRGRRVYARTVPESVVIHSSVLVSEFRGNTTEVIEVCERGERGAGASSRTAAAPGLRLRSCRRCFGVHSWLDCQGRARRPCRP